MLVAGLTELQKMHLAWRLDHQTSCGYLTAGRIARGELYADKEVSWVFQAFGKSERSAKVLAGKVARFGWLDRRLSRATLICAGLRAARAGQNIPDAAAVKPSLELVGSEMAAGLSDLALNHACCSEGVSHV